LKEKQGAQFNGAFPDFATTATAVNQRSRRGYNAPSLPGLDRHPASDTMTIIG